MNVHMILDDLEFGHLRCLNESGFYDVSDSDITDPVNENNRREINEALHFTKKSTSIARSTARKFCKKNRGRILKMADKLRKNKAAQKRKEIMSKSQRSGEKKKKKKKYPGTKDHVNDAVDKKIKDGARQIVENWFSPHHYRVIKSFTLDKTVTASLNEKIEHYGNDSWILEKRDGRRFRFEVNQAVIKPYIKLTALINSGDFM
jgi:hypothetical protein